MEWKCGNEHKVTYLIAQIRASSSINTILCNLCIEATI